MDPLAKTNGASKNPLHSTTWEQKMQPYLDAEGGILEPQYLPKLMQLFETEKNFNILLLFAKAVLHSSPLVHKRFVELDGLKRWIRKWLTTTPKLIQVALELVIVLPMTPEQLKAGHIMDNVLECMSSDDAAVQQYAVKASRKLSAVENKTSSSNPQSPKTTTQTKPTKVTKPPVEKQKLTASNESAFGGGEEAPVKVVPATPKT